MTARSEFRARGYTLVEVLVAFVLLALTLTVLLRSLAAGARNVEVASEYTKAVLLAEAHLAAGTTRSPLLSGGADAGVLADGYAYRRSIVPVDLAQTGFAEPNGALLAHRVSVAVQWPVRDDTRQVTFATIRLDPIAVDDQGRSSW